MARDDPDVQHRARRAWMLALGVLDAVHDPALDAIVAMADRVTRACTRIWLVDGSARHLAAGPARDQGDRGRTGSPTVVRIAIEGLVVAEIESVGGRDGAAMADLVADEAEAVLLARWGDRRRDADGSPVGVVVVDEDLVVRFASPEVDELSGGRDLVGIPVVDLLVERELSVATETLGRSLSSDGRTMPVPIDLDLGSGVAPYTVQADNRLADPEVGLYSFVVRRRREESEELSVLADQMWVLNRLGAGASLDDVLGSVAALVENHIPGVGAAVAVADAERRTVVMRGIGSLPEPVVEAVRVVPVARDGIVGGAVVARDVTRVVPDVGRDQAWSAYLPLLTAHGVAAVWSLPIRSVVDGELLGSLDVYSARAGRPGEGEDRVLLAAARLAAVALDHHAREEVLRHQATHDPLTLLPNRSLFDEELTATVCAGAVGVLFIDLDRFKLVNDTLGHAFGDDLLRAVALRLAAAVEPPALVARFGGDEFTVLVPDATAEDLVAHGERLLSVIGEPYEIRGTRVVVRASAGGSHLAAADGATPEALLRDADAALYRAKDLGRGRIEMFDSELLAAGAERVRVEADLRSALDAGRVGVHFQPAVRLADGAVVGVEALARCWTAEGAAIPPGTFVEVAEEVGLVSDVFDVVLRTACEQAGRWGRRGEHTIVTWVNLSPHQLGSSLIVDQVRRVVEDTAVDPSLLGFEVTEHGIIPDPHEAADCLGKLAAVGCRIAIDDFGTGYSSLGWLQRLPVDTVKLDRSFVVEAGDDPRARAIVRAVVELAGALDLDCVAEGVETPEQLEVVADLGCSVVQGYLYGRPGPAAELETWIARRG